MPSLYRTVKSKTENVLQDSVDYCKGALQSVSRSFALSIPLVEENILGPIMVGYLEARILDTFEDDIGEREISLEERIKSMDLLMEVLEEPDTKIAKAKAESLIQSADELVRDPHYKDLVKNMERVLTVHNSFDEKTKECMVRWLKEMNFGMQKFLKQDVYSFKDLNEYCYYVAGTPSGFLTELIRTNSKELLRDKSKILQDNERDFGLFLQKVNIIRDFREDILDNEKIFWPAFLFEKYNLKPNNLLEQENIETSLKFGKKISGHIIQGHIDCVGSISSIKKIDKSYLFDLIVEPKERKNLIEKASVAINGISLTISKITKKGFHVWVIPHTLKLTNLSKVKKNDLVNIEIDILSKYVRNYFNEK